MDSRGQTQTPGWVASLLLIKLFPQLRSKFVEYIARAATQFHLFVVLLTRELEKKKKGYRAWKDGLAVESTSCSSRQPGFDSQYSFNDSSPSGV